jgi:hypothetical protein
MEINSASSGTISNKSNKREWWNGGKKAAQLSIDFEASELMLSKKSPETL